MTGHVNNVMYNRWAEAGRSLWCRRFASSAATRDMAKQWREMLTPRGTGLILRSIKTDFKFVRCPFPFPPLSI